MKIVQNIQLSENNQISTWLSREDPLDQSKALELSFHPYALRAIIANKPQANIKTLALKWQIKLVDDEEKQPLLYLKSENRILLLFSEMFNGLFECCEQLGININLIRPNTELNTLDFEFSFEPIKSRENILSAALILRIALDSLLFCRGIIIAESILFLPAGTEQSDALHVIFSGA